MGAVVSQRCEFEVDRNIPRNNGYLTLRSKVKVIDRQYWYMTHRLIVMHLFAKYHKPLLKDKESSRVKVFIEEQVKTDT